MARSKLKYSRGTYLKHALMHPWHVVVLAGATVFGVANWSLIVLLFVFLGAEISLLGVVMNLKAFRTYVDERLAMIAKGEAAEWRASLLLRLNDQHRREVVRLETRIDNMEDRFEKFPAMVSYLAHECKELLASYIKIGLQYNMLTQQDSADANSLSGHLTGLRKLQSLKAEPINEQRIAIAEKRLRVLDESVRARSNFLSQLDAISEMILLKTEQAILPSENLLRLRVSDSEEQEVAYIEEDIDVERLALARGR